MNTGAKYLFSSCPVACVTVNIAKLKGAHELVLEIHAFILDGALIGQVAICKGRVKGCGVLRATSTLPINVRKASGELTDAIRHATRKIKEETRWISAKAADTFCMQQQLAAYTVHASSEAGKIPGVHEKNLYSIIGGTMRLWDCGGRNVVLGLRYLRWAAKYSSSSLLLQEQGVCDLRQYMRHCVTLHNAA